MEEKIKYGYISLIIVLTQSLLKILGVIMTKSLSFLSETVDTVIDIIFVLITIFSLYQSIKPPDYAHMFGHKKFDSIGAFVQGIILINIYILIIVSAVQAILTGTSEINNPGIGLVLIVISFGINIVFSRFLIRKGRKKKSLSLEVQGLNLFQDAMRSLLVITSFILALFSIIFLDPYFSIVISLWIIYGAIRLLIKGTKELMDTNPINAIIVEELRKEIFNLDHVNGIEEIKIRASGDRLFLVVNISVEDHISVIHANEIIMSIRQISNELIPFYEVECLVEMNPLAGEKSISENLSNLIYSMKSDFPDILEFKDLNLFFFKDKYFISLDILVKESLTLNEAHDICTEFENSLKLQAPIVSRVISHIETHSEVKMDSKEEILCADIDPDTLETIRKIVENVLKNHPQVKGYHGFECYNTADSCIIEIHVFFDGQLKIPLIHDLITQLEKEIVKKLTIENLQKVILHSEPLERRTDGVYFTK